MEPSFKIVYYNYMISYWIADIEHIRNI